MGICTYLFNHHQWTLFPLLIIFFVFDIFWKLRTKIVFWKYSAPDKHAEKVRYVQKQVREWQTKGNGRHMCTARSQWLSISQQKLNYKSKFYKVEVNMMDILKVDSEKRVVTVEPLVNMRQLIETLAPLGWMVPVLPETGVLTAGGLVMGDGIETTSHKYGLWHNICTRFEVVTADGSLVECSKEKNSDLFHALPLSFGTLGFLVAIDLKLIPYKPYVKVDYQPSHSLTDLVNLFQSEVDRKEGNDSIEGIVFSKDTGVTMTGNFVDEAEPGKINYIHRWYKPWFYKHVETFLEKGRSVEYIPTIDFYFRHDKALFWLSLTVAGYGNHPVFRYLLGWLLPLNTVLLKVINNYLGQLTGIADNFVLQDYVLPATKIKEGLELCHKELDVYPLWLCPVKGDLDTDVRGLPWQKHRMYIDIGAYGFCFKKGYNKFRTLQTLDKFTRECGGSIGLWAEVLMSRDELVEMNDFSLYEKVRKKTPLTIDAFPDIFNKISKLGRS